MPGKWRNKSRPHSDASLREELDHKQMSPQPERSQMTLNQIKTHFPFAKSVPKCRGLSTGNRPSIFLQVLNITLEEPCC